MRQGYKEDKTKIQINLTTHRYSKNLRMMMVIDIDDYRSLYRLNAK